MQTVSELLEAQRRKVSGDKNKDVWGDVLYNVKVYGAKGDGVHDDTQAVQESIDTAIANNATLVFFPPGTYKVTSLANTSTINFVGDNASFVGYNGKIVQLAEHDQIEKKYESKEWMSLFAPKKDPYFQWYQASVIGDSISQGANVSDMSNDSWTGIMRKFFQQEYGTLNYGYVNMLDTLTNPYGTYREVHSIAVNSGTWTDLQDGSYLGSYAKRTSTNLGKITITMSKPCNSFRLFYEVGPTCGIFNVYINGVLSTPINSFSAVSAKFQFSPSFDVSSLTAPFTISVENITTSPITIDGVGYYDNESHMIFNNYARSGLQLKDIDNTMLDIMSSTNLVFFGLGNNDDVIGDLTSFETKIDLLIEKIKAHNSILVVCDFIWGKTLSSSPFKKGLKRLANSCNGLYINFSEDVFGTTDLNQLIAAGILSDGVHLTSSGHQMIAEVVAKRIGLGTTSKKDIEASQRKQYPFLFYNPKSVLTTAVTTEEVLNTYTMPANTFTSREKMKIKAFGLFASNANTKTVKLYFGSLVIATLTGSFSGVFWDISCEIMYRGSAVQIVSTNLVTGSTSSTSVWLPTEDTATPIIIKVTGQNSVASAGDITCYATTIELV